MKTNTTNNKNLGTSPTPKSEYDTHHKDSHSDLILFVAALLFLGLVALVA